MISSLSSRTRSICCNKRWRRRKLPLPAADDGGDGQRIGERFAADRHPKLSRVVGHDAANLFCAECTELMDEANARIELRVA